MQCDSAKFPKRQAKASPVLQLLRPDVSFDRTVPRNNIQIKTGRTHKASPPRRTLVGLAAFLSGLNRLIRPRRRLLCYPPKQQAKCSLNRRGSKRARTHATAPVLQHGHRALLPFEPVHVTEACMENASFPFPVLPQADIAVVLLPQNTTEMGSPNADPLFPMLPGQPSMSPPEFPSLVK